MASTACQCEARQRGLARTCTNKYTRRTTSDRPRCVVRPLPHPVSCCAEGRKNSHPRRAPRNSHTPDRTVFSNWDQPNMFLITLYLAQVAQENHQDMKDESPRQHTLVQFPPLEKISSLGCSKGLPTPRHANFEDVCCGEASFSTAERLPLIRVLVLGAFVPPRTPAACAEHEFLCPSAHHEFSCTTNELSCMHKPCMNPHEFMAPRPCDKDEF